MFVLRLYDNQETRTRECIKRRGRGEVLKCLRVATKQRYGPLTGDMFDSNR